MFSFREPPYIFRWGISSHPWLSRGSTQNNYGLDEKKPRSSTSPPSTCVSSRVASASLVPGTSRAPAPTAIPAPGRWRGRCPRRPSFGGTMAAFHGKIMEKYGKIIRKSRQNKEIHYKWKVIAEKYWEHIRYIARVGKPNKGSFQKQHRKNGKSSHEKIVAMGNTLQTNDYNRRF